jgi:hypothetical protein
MIEDYYDKTATFKRWDSSLDTRGAPDYSASNWDTIYSSKKCMLRPMDTSENFKRGRETANRMFILYCEVLDLKEKDRVYISTNTYEIKGFKNPNSKSHHFEIELEEIR